MGTPKELFEIMWKRDPIGPARSIPQVREDIQLPVRSYALRSDSGAECTYILSLSDTAILARQEGQQVAVDDV
jgi:hypothetical protein